MTEDYHPYKDRTEHDYSNQMGALITRANYINLEGDRIGQELKSLTDMAKQLTIDFTLVYQEHVELMKTRRRKEDADNHNDIDGYATHNND